VTEVSDALALVVSEERGEIALAVNGRLSRNLKEEQLRRFLQHYFSSAEKEGSLLDRIREELKNPGAAEGEGETKRED
jgi:diadenylate cyclase